MNITHAQNEIIEGDRLKAIFERQEQLMSKYHDIELRSGLLQTEDCPINLDDKRGQARIKDFAWRVMEEVGEALDADNHQEHYQEELIDGLHFLTELTILTGVKYDELGFTPQDGEQDCLEAIYNCGGSLSIGNNLNDLVTRLVRELGMMCNCLKNKPWKQSHMKTDKEAFFNRLAEVWVTYMGILVIANMDSDQIADIYLKKSQVNIFRQRSNY